MVTEDQMYTKELFIFEKNYHLMPQKITFYNQRWFGIIKSHDTDMQAAMTIGRIMRIMVWLHDRTFKQQCNLFNNFVGHFILSESDNVKWVLR